MAPGALPDISFLKLRAAPLPRFEFFRVELTLPPLLPEIVLIRLCSFRSVRFDLLAF